MRKYLVFPALLLVLALITATAVWAQTAPTAPGKAAHKACAMHTQGAAADCCQHGKACCEMACCEKGQCTQGACSCCGDAMACCADGQQCEQACCTQTEQGMQCTMAEHIGLDCATHCQQTGGHARHHAQ